MAKAQAQAQEKSLVRLEERFFDMQTLIEGSEDLNDNLENIDVRLSNIKIHHQAQMFEMPDGQKIDEFDALILDFHRVNAFWLESFDQSGGNTPPDCFSGDGEVPAEDSNEKQSETCKHCPQNKFGSEHGHSGRGKACKNMKRVHLITSHQQMLPFRLILPPSNIRPFDSYISALVTMGYPWRATVTGFGLKESKNKDGIKYSELSLVPQYVVGKDQVAASREIAKKLSFLMRETHKEEIESTY